MDATNGASRRSTRKRKSAPSRFSPPPAPQRKKVSEVFQSADDGGNEDGQHGKQSTAAQEGSEVQQKKSKKAIKKETESENNKDDSGNYDTSSVSELSENSDEPPQLFSVIALPNGRKSNDRDESEAKKVAAAPKPQLQKQNIGQSFSEAAAAFVQELQNSLANEGIKIAKPAATEIPKMEDSSVSALQALNPALFLSAFKQPTRNEDTIIVAFMLLEDIPTPFGSDTVVSFLQDAENASQKFIEAHPISMKKPRISLEKAWEAVAVTYGLFGPTVVPIILHFIKQQNSLETKHFNNPSALFLYTLMIVKLFHEHLMPLLNPQISITHAWILDILEQQYLRSYLTLAHWVNYFEPRISSTFVTDPSISSFKIVTDFMNQLVSDPYACFLTGLKKTKLISSCNVVILLPQMSLVDDKLSLIALLFRGLDNVGCKIRLCPLDQDISKEYEKIKAENPISFVFTSEISLQQTHFSSSFGSICYSFNLLLQCLEPSLSGYPTKLQLTASNHDGSKITEDSLVNNNITPACICRYYLEHITGFIECTITSSVKHRQQQQK